MEPPRDFFSNGNQHDRARVGWIAWKTNEQGYSSVIQSWDFRPVSTFALEMKVALERVRRIIAVLCPNCLSSKAGQAEWAAAFATDPAGEERFVLTARVAEVKLRSPYAAAIYIDLIGKSEAECQSELLIPKPEVMIRPRSRSARRCPSGRKGATDAS